MSTFKTIIKKNRGLIFAYLCIGIVCTFFETFSVNLFQNILDSFTIGNVNVLYIVIYAILTISSYILRYFENYPGSKLESKIFLDLKINAITKISTIDYKEYQGLGTGKLLQIIENGSNAGRNILHNFYFMFIREILPCLVFSLFFIAKIDLRIMGIILIGYLVIFAITNVLLKFLYSIKKEVLLNEESLNRKLTRGFMELIVFRVYRRYNDEIKKCEQMEHNIVEGKCKLLMTHEAFFAIFAVLVGIVKIIILCAQFLQWNLSVGEIVALLTLVEKAYSPIAIFNVLYIGKKLDQVAYERYIDVLSLPDDIALEQNSDKSVDTFSISIDNVSYAYGDNTVVNDVSLNIDYGKNIAFVGESGSGKTTLIKMILGLLKYKDGSIKIGSSELSELKLNDYYQNVSYISQDVPIFDGSIRENIVFDKKVDDDEIMKILELVCLKGYVEALKDGLDTEIGEKGQLLSGGEKQKLALARVFFDDSKLVILDEATSAIDNITEHEIMENVLTKLKDRTVIVIAHRINAIEKVDMIYVMKDAKIVDEGNFDELLEKSAYFKRLWQAGQVD